ncbi:ubiquinone biosynthesis o-methyltransferase family protein [Cryptosporidium serpentis]
MFIQKISYNFNYKNINSKSLHSRLYIYYFHKKYTTGYIFRNKNVKYLHSTADEKEINHFNKFSSEWWNPNGIYKGLHWLNNSRIEFIKEVVADKYNSLRGPLYNLRIMDIGCGGGLLSETLAKLGGDILGIDLSYPAIKIALKHGQDYCNNNLNISELQNINNLKEYLKNAIIPNRISYYVGDIEEISLIAPNSFDIVIASEIIEHVREPKQFVKFVGEVLKNNGIAIFTTINRTFLSYFLTITMMEDILQIIPKKTHTWEKYIKPSELDRYAFYADMIKIKSSGYIFIPGMNCFVASKYMDFCNYFCAYKKTKDQ